MNACDDDMIAIIIIITDSIRHKLTSLKIIETWLHIHIHITYKIIQLSFTRAIIIILIEHGYCTVRRDDTT